MVTVLSEHIQICDKTGNITIECPDGNEEVLHFSEKYFLELIDTAKELVHTYDLYVGIKNMRMK